MGEMRPPIQNRSTSLTFINVPPVYGTRALGLHRTMQPMLACGFPAWFVPIIYAGGALWLSAACLALCNLITLSLHARELGLPQVLACIGSIAQGFLWAVVPDSFWGEGTWLLYLVTSPLFVIAHFFWLRRLRRSMK